MSDELIQVVNAVGGGELGVEVQLDELLADSSFEYEFETGDSIAYISLSEDSPTVTLFRSGKYSIAGADSVSELYNADEEFRREVSDIIGRCIKNESNFEIRYLVGIGELDSEFNLTDLMEKLPTEKVEYEPEQFPGLFYRPSEDTTVIIFATGKISVNGPRSEEGLRQEFARIDDEISNQ